MVHHDLWDYDLTAAPKLLTVRHGGRSRDIVAQLTKHGQLFVFDRVTGEPLWPIEERPVPKSAVPGEQAWPTQPFPVRPAPFARQSFTREEINPHLGPEEKARVLERFLAAANEGIFTPLAVGREQFTMPGQFGGGNWGGSAADPTTGMLYVRTTDQPTISELREFDPKEPSTTPPTSAREDGLKLFTGTRYTGPLGQAFRAKSGPSAIGPPWSEIVAYDLNEGTIKWRAPFGTSPALAARGITDTGNARRAWRNGPVVTAGGLIFLGSWADRTVRAFDARTGKPLWEFALKANQKASCRCSRSTAGNMSRSARQGPRRVRLRRLRRTKRCRGWRRRRGTTCSLCRRRRNENATGNRMKKPLMLAAVVLAVLASRGPLQGAASESSQAGTKPPAFQRAPDALERVSHRTRTAVGDDRLTRWRYGIDTASLHNLSADRSAEARRAKVEARSAEADLTFLDAVVRTDAIVVEFVEGGAAQKVGPRLQKDLNDTLTDSERAAVRAGMGMPCGCSPTASTPSPATRRRDERRWRSPGQWAPR